MNLQVEEEKEKKITAQRGNQVSFKQSCRRRLQEVTKILYRGRGALEAYERKELPPKSRHVRARLELGKGTPEFPPRLLHSLDSQTTPH